MNTLRAGQQPEDSKMERRETGTSAPTDEQATPPRPVAAHPPESSRPWAAHRADAPSWVDNVEPF